MNSSFVPVPRPQLLSSLKIDQLAAFLQPELPAGTFLTDPGVFSTLASLQSQSWRSELPGLVLPPLESSQSGQPTEIAASSSRVRPPTAVLLQQPSSSPSPGIPSASTSERRLWTRPLSASTNPSVGSWETESGTCWLSQIAGAPSSSQPTGWCPFMAAGLRHEGETRCVRTGSGCRWSDVTGCT